MAVFWILYIFMFALVCVDPGSGNPVHSEEHQKEPWREGLALVEPLHYSAAPH